MFQCCQLILVTVMRRALRAANSLAKYPKYKNTDAEDFDVALILIYFAEFAARQV